MSPLRHGGQGGDTDQRYTCAQRQPLRHADADPHPGKGAGTTAEGDGIELVQGYPGLVQHSLNHGQDFTGVIPRRLFPTGEYLFPHQQGGGAGFGGGIYGQDLQLVHAFQSL